MSDDELLSAQSQDFWQTFEASQSEKMPDPIGYFVPRCKIAATKTFTGGVSVPIGWSSGNLYDRLCLYFKKANVKKISDTADMKQKAGNEVLKIKTENNELEEEMLSKLESATLWSLQEVEEWLEKAKGSGESKVQVTTPKKNNPQEPHMSNQANPTQANMSKDPKKDEERKEVKTRILEDLRLAKEEVVKSETEEGQLEVSLMVGENIYVLKDNLLEDCVTALDSESGEETLAKQELAKLAKFGLKLLPSVIQENKSLTEKLKKKEDEIVKLQKECFETNTRELLVKKELEVLKQTQLEKQETQQKQQNSGMLNKVVIKLEEIQKENKAFREEVKTNSLGIERNTSRTVDILGGLKKDIQKERIQSICKVKVTQELEETQKTITFYGSVASLQYLDRAQGELRRDLDSLMKKKMVMLETTELTGVENILTLVKKAVEKRSVAVIVLNMGAETAELFLDDTEYTDTTATQMKSAAKKVAAAAKENFDRVIFVVPPHTAQSYTFIEKMAESLKDGDGFEILDISKTQIEMGKGQEDDQTWKINTGRSLKLFSITKDDEVKEGWNNFSSNVMITEVASLLSDKESKLICCGECGLGHIKSFHCQKEGESRDEDRMDNKSSGASNNNRHGQSSYNHNLTEECLYCFGAHDEKACNLPEDFRCNYPGCFRQGHKRVVHHPKKKDTVERLKAKYKEGFSISSSDPSKKREGNRESSRDVKRTRGERDRSRE